LLVGATGCGSDDHSARPENTQTLEAAIDGALSAYNKRDAAATCSYMTPAGQAWVVATGATEGQPPAGCADVVGDGFPPSPIHIDLRLNVGPVSVDGERAVVGVADRRTPADVVTLYGVRTEGGWRLDAAQAAEEPVSR
jgi:hypothetical protein